ncbi:MAG: nucleotide-binding protein [Ignavibacteria bacterium]|nr:nucleotide-binding protein [Ignavibacteria bacterium]
MKPRIFIGSSVEGLPIAKAIQTNLDHYAFTEIWSQIDFTLSSTTLDSLIEQANNSDFAIFVFNPDDALKIRNNEVKTVRDNVLFELGLFMGAISRNKVYFIKPRGVELHIPTDLWGVTSGEYEPAHPNLTASLGPFCTKVEKLIKSLYLFEFPENSRWGINLLSANITQIEEGKHYCLHAKIPKNSKLVLKFSNVAPKSIGFSLSEKQGFAILTKSPAGIETIDLQEPEGTFGVVVSPNSRFTIEAYINDNTTPLFTKSF